MTRGKVKDQNLMLVSGGLTATSFNPVAGHADQHGDGAQGRHGPQARDQPATGFNAAELNPIPSPPPQQDPTQLRAEAQMKGYTGDQCSNCNSMRMKVSGPLHGVRGLRDDDWV